MADGHRSDRPSAWRACWGSCGPSAAGPVQRLTVPGFPRHALPLDRESQAGSSGAVWVLHGDHGGIATHSIGAVHVGSASAVARSAYRKQMERIAPPELVGRNAELRELAAYCTEPNRGPYAWWRAPAWAGKSALMSTFVLHPPAGVKIVAFFITARLGAQDTREAFTEVVLEQLAELLGQDLPPWSAATRDAHLLGMLEQAAEACAARGERLILAVDGLDEDRGLTTGGEAHSIAALLPNEPPAGMRVIVAGRPNPPIPDDVPGWHRLRDPAIVRSLAPSDRARDIKVLAQRELRRLLQGTPVQQDLLGLLTAARGGLSGPDLAALTGEPLWEIEDVVHAVSGRTFTRQVSAWQPETGPEVFLLGHEELQSTALAYLGGGRLTAYQDRLHTWAEEYRNRKWPATTPEYLLTGYFQMLAAAGDAARLAACGADAPRQERMLAATGGDAAALNEITIALDLNAAQDDPDLTAALRLARRRDYLADRNANIPTQLPAVWATLGQHIRAEALARSITNPDARAWALVAVAGALAQAGHDHRAASVAAQAEATARFIPSLNVRARALVAVAGALAQVGHHHRAASVATQAEATARSVADLDDRIRILVAVAGALAQAGYHQQAEATARSIASPDVRARALVAVAGALAQGGHRHQAGSVAAQAEATARSIPSLNVRVRILASVAGALAKAGHHQQAATLAANAEAAARSITYPESRAWAQVEVAEALAQTGHHQQAEAAARSITSPDARVQALVAVAGALAQAGQHEQAASVAARADAAARSSISPREQARALVAVAGALAQAGHHEQAASVAARADAAARSITDPDAQARALVAVAGALAQAGHHEQAASVAARADAAARSITDPDAQARALVAVAGTLAQAGDHEQAAGVAVLAEATARSITDPGAQAWVLMGVAGALAQAGDRSAGRRRGPVNHRSGCAGAGTGGDRRRARPSGPP